MYNNCLFTARVSKTEIILKCIKVRKLSAFNQLIFSYSNKQNFRLKHEVTPCFCGHFFGWTQFSRCGNTNEYW